MGLLLKMDIFKDCIPISLGYNCFVRVYFQEFVKATPRYVFDWTGIPMWAICECMDSNFKDFSNKEFLVKRKRFTNTDEVFLTNTKYNTVFLHDYGKPDESISDALFERVEQDYLRRIERWNAAIHGITPLLFVRVEMSNRPRIDYEGSTRQYKEHHYVMEFAEKLKSVGTNYHILFITHSCEQGYDSDKKIISLKYTPNKPDMVVMGRHIDAILNANKTFIKSCLDR
jgi:hypothetical protein